VKNFDVLLLGLFGAVKGRLLFFFGIKFAGFLETSISPKTLFDYELFLLQENEIIPNRDRLATGCIFCSL